MGVAVGAGGGTVSSPTGVRDTGMGLKGLAHVICAVIDEFLQLGHLANFLECADFILLVAIHGHTSRVVATVLQSGEAWGNNGEQKVKIIGIIFGHLPLSSVSMMNLRSFSTR